MTNRAQDATAASFDLAAAPGEICAAGHAARTCGCRLCVRAGKFLTALESIPERLHPFLHSLYDELEAAEMDRDVNRAVIEGKWPNADECIAAARKPRDGDTGAAAVQESVETQVKHEEAPPT